MDIMEKINKGREYRKMELNIGEPDSYNVRGYATTFDTAYTLWDTPDFRIDEIVDAHAFDGCDIRDVIFQYDHEGRVFARTSNDTLQLNTGATKAQMSELVKSERQRELMYEGKRWYDLVRYAMRAGNTNEIISATSKRDDVNAGFVANFFKKMDAIFWPYNLEELKVNRNLVPNPAFSSGENESMDKS
jgi:hypothetical protein